MARAKTPEQLAAVRSKAATKAAKTRATNRVNQQAADGREKFEANNPERVAGLGEKGMLGSNNQISIKHAYRAMGFTDKAPQLHGQMELSSHDGSEVFQGGDSIAPHREMMPVNRRWEDFTPKEQERVLSSARKYGVTRESAHHALAAQVDQAYLHEGGHHDSFYSPQRSHSDAGDLTPRYRLKESAKANNVPFGLQAAANAITSPQNKFVVQDRKSGAIRYPNDEAATHAIKWAQEGKTGDEYHYHPDYHVPASEKVEKVTAKRNGTKVKTLVKAPGDTRAYPVNGYPDNHARAIDVAHQVMGGKALRDAWKPTDAEKVTAYHNSWVDPHGSSQFWVSDTHSGGGAFAPHLNKDEQSKYMGVTGIHAFHDHVARSVMSERGLNSLTNMQSAQWSQEKRSRGDNHDAALNTYAQRNLSGGQFTHVKGQETLF